jgi:hypothetical protein
MEIIIRILLSIMSIRLLIIVKFKSSLPNSTRLTNQDSIKLTEKRDLLLIKTKILFRVEMLPRLHLSYT